jgi:glycosyltransferase involved in cell wall biosynthesis
MNVLQVAPTNVYPPSGGGQHRSHGLVSAFPEWGDEVYRYCQGGHLGNYLSLDRRRRVRVSEGYEEFQHLHPLFDLARVPELWGLPNVFLGRSLGVVEPTRLLDRLGWADVVVVEFPWQVAAVAEFVPETPVVYSSHNVEVERFEGCVDSPVGEWFAARARTLERRALEASTAVVCTSARDRAEYRRRFDVDIDCLVAPNGVDRRVVETRNAAGDGGAVRDRHGIDADGVALFVGTDYGPNRDAARAVLGMADDSAGNGPDVHYLVVGSVGNSISTQKSNVTVTGFVPDLDPYFGAADVCLNPVRSGSGTNIKLLEYMGRGLPVVTTEFGSRGFDVAHTEEVLVVDVPDFVDAVERILTTPALRERLSEAGRSYVRDNHVWEDISENLNTSLKGLI